MTALSGILLASFTTPMHIDTDPLSMLWLLPLVASIAVVYKATKVYKIVAFPFIRESADMTYVPSCGTGRDDDLNIISSK